MSGTDKKKFIGHFLIFPPNIFYDFYSKKKKNFQNYICYYLDSPRSIDTHIVPQIIIYLLFMGGGEFYKKTKVNYKGKL